MKVALNKVLILDNLTSLQYRRGVPMSKTYSVPDQVAGAPDKVAGAPDHWLTAKKGVHQFRSFLSNMRTPKSMTKQGKYSL